MAFQTNISPLNSFEMLPEQVIRPALYHNGNLDEDFQADLIKDYEENAIYFHPVERGDPFRFQVSTVAHLSKSLTVVDCNGLTVLTIAQTNFAVLAGNKSVDNDQMTAYDYRLPDLSGIAADGVYYLLFTVEYDVDHTSLFISQPWALADVHEDTMLIEYRHSTNRLKFYFEQMPTIGRLRVRGCIPENSISNESNDVTFSDQEEDKTVVNSVAFNSWKFYVGIHGEGIPAWLYRKLGVIFGCNELYIDGRAYTKGESKWEKTTADDVPVFGASITLYLPDNNARYQFVDADVSLYTAPTPPYAIGYIELFNGNGSVQLTEPIIIEDGAGETAFIAFLNASLQALELTGNFVKVGSAVHYINGISEKYRYALSFVTDKVFSYDVASPSITYSSLFDFGLGQVVIDWGDASHIDYAYSNTSAVNTSVLHYFPAATTYTVRVFHDESTEIIEINEPYLSAMTPGDVPGNLKQLNVYGSASLLASFDFDFVAGASALQSLILRSDISTVTNLSPTPFGLVFNNLDLVGNSLASADIDNVILAIKETVHTNGGALNGTAALQFQNPSGAPPTITGNTAITLLSSSYGWTITTD